MDVETEQLLRDAAARPTRTLDVAALQDRRRRRRERRRACGAFGVVAVLAVAVLGGAELIGSGPSVDFSPANPGGDAAAVGHEVPLPEPGEVGRAWLEAEDDLAVPVFVIRDPAGDVHAIRATTSYLNDVEAAVGWCKASSVFLAWSPGSLFAPDGSYLGGPAPRGLDTFETELTDRGTVRIGAARPGLSRDESQRPAEGQEARWGDGGPGPRGVGAFDPIACYDIGSPDDALVLHGSPGTDLVADGSTTTPGAIALDGPGRPDGWVLIEGTLVLSDDPDQPTVLCDDLAVTDPPTCPDGATRARIGPLREGAGTWAYTGVFRTAVIGSMFDRVTLVTADVSHVSAEEDAPPPLDPPLQYPESTVTDDVVTVAAGDVHYGPPPPPFPAGTYELRLDNSGHLPHTLVNDDLGVSLRAARGHRDSIRVDLPTGQHTFVCEIQGHTEVMQITLTVD
jgi:hypothetical protein